MKARKEINQLINLYSITLFSRDLNRLRTMCANIYYRKDFTVNITSHAWKRKFVGNLVYIVCFMLVD